MYHKVFIAGPPRSGSHFLYKAFRINPKVIAHTREAQLFQDIIGIVKHSRLFWKRNINTLIEKYDGFKGMKAWGTSKEDLQKMVLEVQKITKNKDEQIVFLIRSILNNYHAAQGGDESKILVEKTPTNILFGDYILDNFQEAKIICLVRNPEDCIKSLSKLAKKNTYWVPKTLDKQIAIWTNSVKKVVELKAKKEYQSRLHFVKYEELMNGNISSTLLSAFSFADCDLGASDFDGLINKLPIRENNEKASEYFSVKDFEYIKSKTAKLKQQLGY